MSKIRKMSSKEQKVITMCVVQACLQYANENQKAFEDVLNEDLFPAKASQEYSDMVCYNIKQLVDDGYLDGEVELEYDELEPGEDASKGICVTFSSFENISITEKGNIFIKTGNFGVIAAEVKDVAVPILKTIGNATLATLTEVAIYTALGI